MATALTNNNAAIEYLPPQMAATQAVQKRIGVCISINMSVLYNYKCICNFTYKVVNVYIRKIYNSVPNVNELCTTWTILLFVLILQ